MILLGKVALGLFGTCVAGAGLLCSEGMIQVNVVEKRAEGHHIRVMAPALLVPIGMHFAPRDGISEASAQIQPWMPTIRAALEQLRECDDFALVEVKEPGQEVRVTKSGGSLVVDVNNGDETVHVSAPIRALSSAAEELAAAAPVSEK
jgi:hypothetical protein